MFYFKLFAGLLLVLTQDTMGSDYTDEDIAICEKCCDAFAKSIYWRQEPNDPFNIPACIENGCNGDFNCPVFSEPDRYSKERSCKLGREFILEPRNGDWVVNDDDQTSKQTRVNVWCLESGGFYYIAETKAPTPAPTHYPTPEPTNYPTPEPTNYPTPEPTNYPTPAPTNFPTPAPTNFPTPPTIKPTSAPTSIEDRKVKDPSAGDDGDSSVLIIAGVGCTLVILVLALIIVRRRRKRRRKSDETGIVAAYNNESGSSSRHPYLKPNVDINDTGFSNVSQQRNPAAASYEVDVDYASEDVNTGYSPEYGYGQNENAYGSSSMTESYDMSTNEKMGAPPPPTFPRMIRRRNSPFNVHDNEYGVDTSYNSYESSNTFSMENSDAPPAPPPAPHRQRNPVNQKNPANQRNFQDLEF